MRFMGSKNTVRENTGEGEASATDDCGSATPALPRQVRHDLRSGIGQVIGYSELWLDEIEEESGPIDVDSLRRDLARVKAAGRRILDLVNDYIDPVGPRARAEDTMYSSAAFPSPAEAPSAPVTEAPKASNETEVTSVVAPARVDQASLPDDSAIMTANIEGNGPLHTVTLSPPPGQARLLIVDDSEANRDMLLRRLDAPGRILKVARSGREALTLLESEPFDLVLLDIRMPDMDGYEVLKRMKVHDTLRHLPVIMISALDELDSVIRCIELGADDYLPKPFDPILLRARIGACLEKKRLRDGEMRLFAQLQENYRRLKELETLRDDLTNMIVHDLRTPLTSLLTGLQTLGLSAAMDEMDHEIMSLSIAGGETLLGMINDLLDVGKMEDGSLKLERAPLCAQELVTEAVQQVAALAREKSLTIDRELGQDLPEIAVDSDKFRRTLVNLLGNAVKFTPEGGIITVVVSLIPEESAIRFCVRDTGEGIPREAFGRIFDKFGQVDTRKSGRKMSTGLGLTFCKMVVEAHGGRIWVESEPGQGSEFLFTIPCQ
jgi:two-component system sensor histidine kinase/response regulator